MAMMTSTGGGITDQATEHATTDVAILLDERTSRYGDGYATFRLQSTTGLQPNTPIPTEQTLDLTNLMNAEPFVVNKVVKAACVKLKLPRYIRRQFKTKYIPPGTTFDCTFLGNDYSKATKTGVHEDPTGSVKLDGKINEHELG